MALSNCGRRVKSRTAYGAEPRILQYLLWAYVKGGDFMRVVDFFQWNGLGSNWLEL